MKFKIKILAEDLKCYDCRRDIAGELVVEESGGKFHRITRCLYCAHTRVVELIKKLGKIKGEILVAGMYGLVDGDGI